MENSPKSLDNKCSKNCVAEKANFFRLFQRFRAPADEQRFKYYQAVVNKLVKASKNQYYGAFFPRNFTNSRRFFRELNALCCREKRPSNIVLPNGNTLLGELEDVIKALNSKFVSLALPRNDKVSTIVSDIAENEHSFFLHPVDMVKLERYVAELKDGKLSGLDGLSAKIVKSSLAVLREPLLYMFNRFLSEGVFPESLKRAKILPLHTKAQI